LPPGCEGAHTPDFYEDRLKKIIDSGLPFDSVCFKDASGTSVPKVVYETIKRARKILPSETLIDFHTHETAGASIACYLAALDAGADAIDLSMAPCSGGTCQPDIVTMWHALRGSEYSLDIDIEKVLKAEEVFKDCMKDYFLPPEACAVEPTIPWNPMPGGALTANTQMLRDNGIMDKYVEISRAMGDAVRKGGFGTSVTPVSQFYFQQAFNNVMFGEWKKIADGYGKMVLGYFGKTPVEPDAEVVKLASEQLGLPPTTKTPLEINDADPKKGLVPARKRLEEAKLPISDENLFISAACGDKGIDFLLGKAKVSVRYNEAPKPAVEAPKASVGEYTVMVEGRPFEVAIKDGVAVVNGREFKTDIKAGFDKSAPAAAPVAPASKTAVKAPMPGVVRKILVAQGADVKEKQALIIIEAMKMEVEITAPASGKVASIDVQVGQQIAGDAKVATIG